MSRVLATWPFLRSCVYERINADDHGKDVCQERSKWKAVLSDYSDRKRASSVCMDFSTKLNCENLRVTSSF